MSSVFFVFANLLLTQGYTNGTYLRDTRPADACQGWVTFSRFFCCFEKTHTNTNTHTKVTVIQLRFGIIYFWADKQHLFSTTHFYIFFFQFSHVYIVAFIVPFYSHFPFVVALIRIFKRKINSKLVTYLLTNAQTIEAPDIVGNATYWADPNNTKQKEQWTETHTHPYTYIYYIRKNPGAACRLLRCQNFDAKGRFDGHVSKRYTRFSRANMVDIVFAARILSLATNVSTHAYLLGANLITVCELDALQIEYMFLQGFFSLIVIYI